MELRGYVGLLEVELMKYGYDEDDLQKLKAILRGGIANEKVM